MPRRHSECFLRGADIIPSNMVLHRSRRLARLKKPPSWRQPRRILRQFDEPQDLFHLKVLREFINQVLDTMGRARQTNAPFSGRRSAVRSSRAILEKCFPTSLAPSHIWLGVSVEEK